MAMYEVLHTCGHVKIVQLCGPEKDRQRKLDWMRTCVCSDCSRKQKAEEAAQRAAELGLPVLQGSEKQVAWAVTIRERLLQTLSEFKGEMALANQPQDLLDAFDKILDGIKAQDSASWWIDRREYGPRTLIRDYRRNH